MAIVRIGCGAALAWTLAVCAALMTPAIAGGGGSARDTTNPAVIVSGGDFTEKAQEGYLGFYYAFNRDLDR